MDQARVFNRNVKVASSLYSRGEAPRRATASLVRAKRLPHHGQAYNRRLLLPPARGQVLYKELLAHDGCSRFPFIARTGFYRSSVDLEAPEDQHALNWLHPIAESFDICSSLGTVELPPFVGLAVSDD